MLQLEVAPLQMQVVIAIKDVTCACVALDRILLINAPMLTHLDYLQLLLNQGLAIFLYRGPLLHLTPQWGQSCHTPANGRANFRPILRTNFQREFQVNPLEMFMQLKFILALQV